MVLKKQPIHLNLVLITENFLFIRARGKCTGSVMWKINLFTGEIKKPRLTESYYLCREEQKTITAIKQFRQSSSLLTFPHVFIEYLQKNKDGFSK